MDTLQLLKKCLSENGFSSEIEIFEERDGSYMVSENMNINLHDGLIQMTSKLYSQLEVYDLGKSLMKEFNLKSIDFNDKPLFRG